MNIGASYQQLRWISDASGFFSRITQSTRIKRLVEQLRASSLFGPEFRLSTYLYDPAKSNSETLPLALDTIRCVAESSR